MNDTPKSGVKEEDNSPMDISIKLETNLVEGDQLDLQINDGDQLHSAPYLQRADDGDNAEYEFYKNVTDKQRRAARKYNECFVCKKRMPSFASLKRHVMNHANAKKFQCHLCVKSYSERRYLEEHLLTHSGTAHTCQVCFKNFASSRSLLGHTRIHTGEKRYKCEVCGKAFTESSTRTKHMATHSTEKHFKCSQCEKMFSRKSHLQSHLNTHAKEEFKLSIGESGQECAICFKNVTGDLKRHLEYHEIMKQHEGIAKKPKKFTCELCGKCYDQYKNLRAHMWRHTGKKDFTCDICTKDFSHLANLKKHMKIHIFGSKRKPAKNVNENDVSTSTTSSGFDVIDFTQSIFHRYGVPNGFYAHPMT